tara:strand:- start:2923 stop:3264 length:342 start_codon:yes stop_codon:yes gene_type:complete
MLKKNFKKAAFLSLSFIGLIYFLDNKNNVDLFSFEFFLIFLMYLVLFSISLDAYKKSKIAGVLLLFSLLLLPPAIFPKFAGNLFPVTYGVFIVYLFITHGINMFKNWKNNTGL